MAVLSNIDVHVSLNYAFKSRVKKYQCTHALPVKLSEDACIKTLLNSFICTSCSYKACYNIISSTFLPSP